MTIPIIFEDEFLLAINKPAGLLVHGLADKRLEISDQRLGRQTTTPTLVDWLIEQYPEVKDLVWPDATRPGIVHRLDRDTSGVMILAKTPEVLAKLQEQFHDRQVKKTYLCLVIGSPDWQEKTMVAAVSRGKGTRRRASFFVAPEAIAKPAETRFHVLERFELAESGIWNLESGEKNRNSQFAIRNSRISLFEAHPLTGRTHQIRVHLGLEGYPILGDPWYQTKPSRDLAKQLDIPRLMLHAQKLKVGHPLTGKILTLTTPLPADFKKVIDHLTKGGKMLN